MRGYNPAKNDFLFERRLTDHVFDVVSEFSQGKPALIFCRCVCTLHPDTACVCGSKHTNITQHSARKGTVDTAHKLLEASRNASAGAAGTLFLRDPAQLQRLSAAAANLRNKSLAAVLRGGVAFHHSGMEPEERELVERLFRQQDVRVRG